MAKNTKQTSSSIASLAGATLRDPHASGVQKSLAGGVLSQVNRNHQTGPEMEPIASRALASDRSAELTKALAASLVSQSNKKR